MLGGEVVFTTKIYNFFLEEHRFPHIARRINEHSRLLSIAYLYGGGGSRESEFVFNTLSIISADC